MREKMWKIIYTFMIALGALGSKCTALAAQTRTESAGSDEATVPVYMVIIVLTALFTVYQLFRCIVRNREIEKIEDEMMRQAEYRSQGV